MKKYETNIQGSYILEYNLFPDTRGYFTPYLITKELTDLDFQKVSQCSRSLSHKNVLRGLHYQISPHAQSKIVECLNGRMVDMVVDLRENSPTYLNHIFVELNATDNKLLYIPKGCAQGFVALEDNTLVSYLTDDDYYPQLEKGISYNDKVLNIDWDAFKMKYQIDDFIISAKDLSHLPYSGDYKG